MYKRMKVYHNLTPYTKINSKWIKDLKVRPETIKFLEENIGSTLFDISLRGMFLNSMSTWIRETKEKINKWDFIRASARQRKTGSKGKDNPPAGRKYLQIIYPTRG